MEKLPESNIKELQLGLKKLRPQQILAMSKKERLAYLKDLTQKETTEFYAHLMVNNLNDKDNQDRTI
jgi:hypothetical protein